MQASETHTLSFRELVEVIRRSYPLVYSEDTVGTGGITSFRKNATLLETLSICPDSPDRIRKYWKLAVRIA